MLPQPSEMGPQFLLPADLQSILAQGGHSLGPVMPQICCTQLAKPQSMTLPQPSTMLPQLVGVQTAVPQAVLPPVPAPITVGVVPPVLFDPAVLAVPPVFIEPAPCVVPPVPGTPIAPPVVFPG
jgi:hypothetical protein